MQLSPTRPATALRLRLRAAAAALLAAGAVNAARAETPAARWQFDATGLGYVERSRTVVIEPVARITRLFESGQSLWLQTTLDAMTGASPTGAQPSGRVQTVTSASGTVSTSTANQVPTAPFHDFRGALDLGGVQPLGGIASIAASGHYSREKDYTSRGGTGQFSLDLDRHLITVTVGGSLYRDTVTPVGGIRVPLSDGTSFLPEGALPRRTSEGSAGISRVLSRRWMVSLNGSRTHEEGYLTEPYKIVSLIEGDGTPSPDSLLTEGRPGTRNRNALMASSVYHLTDDVLYASYRYYWDDWGVRSHTLDLKYHEELPLHDYLVPHLRLYTQTRADFFVFGLPQGGAVPRYATSDLRLGPLHSVTLGLTYGFTLPDHPGEFTIRGEYIHQWGDGHPASAIGVQQQLDLFPGEDVYTVTGGYTLRF